jgi:hypothetical protein
LVQKFGIPSEQLAPFTAWSPDPETAGIKLLRVEWRVWPTTPSRPDGTTWLTDTRLGFVATFDLQSGEVKYISFSDRELIEALGRAQRKTN